MTKKHKPKRLAKAGTQARKNAQAIRSKKSLKQLVFSLNELQINVLYRAISY